MKLKTNEEIKKFCIDLLKLESSKEIKNYLKKYGFWDNKECWRYYGDNENNIGIINNQSSNSIKCVVEKITNSYDSRLIYECKKNGIDPRDKSTAPSSIKEAMDKFFYKKKDTKFNEFLKLENETAIFSTGETTNPNISIIDKGEGISPINVPNTILSLNKGNKKNMNFVQGTYNQGGSGVLNFCEEGLSLILCRKAPDINNSVTHETDDEWSLTVTRKMSAVENDTENPYFTYLAPFDKNKDISNGKLGVLSFKADKLKMWPDGVDQYKKDYDHGVLVKLIGYELKSKTNIVIDFMYHTEIMMPDAVMPCRLHECRDYYKRNRGSKDYRDQVTTLQGFLYRNSKEKIKALEDDFPLEDSITFKNYNFPIKVFAFQYDAEKKNSKANRRRMSDEGLLFVLGGQHYAHERTSFFTKQSLGYSRIKNDLIVIVDCTGIDGDLKNELFKADKTTMYNRKTSNELVDEVIDFLGNNCPQLRELVNKRKEQQINEKLRDDKPFEKTLQQIIKKSPSLAALLKIGPRLSNPFNTKKTGEKKVDKIDLKFFPTFFKFKKDLDKGEIYKRDGNINKRLRFDLKTDAENEYFIRDKSPGSLIVDVILKTNNEELLVEQKDLSYNKHLKDGHMIFSLKIPEVVKKGNLIKLKLSITDENNEKPWVLESEISILGEADKQEHERNGKNKKKDKGKKDNPTGFSLPNVNWVKEEDWSQPHLNFDNLSAMAAVHGGTNTEGGKEVQEWDFYLNEDNLYLQTELKASISSGKLDPKILRERYKVAMVFFALSIIDFEEKKHKKENSNEDLSMDIIEENIKKLSSSISSVVLPVIESLGDEDDLAMYDTEA